MELIDKEALLERLYELADINREWKPEFTEFCEEMICMVEDSPYWHETDFDESVVRCRHCERQQVCRLAQRLGVNGFCSEGERKDT